MINTYQTSGFPPPVPTRLSLRAPESGQNRAVVRVLVGVVALHLLLSVGGFFYLFTDRRPSALESANSNGEAKPSARSSERRSEKASHIAMASMTVKPPPPPHRATDKAAMQYLQWNMDHSLRRNVDYQWPSWLKVKQAGDYYVYARVSFSRGGAPGLPLLSAVRLKPSAAGEPRDVMKAYCSLGGRTKGQCTASQGQVLRLQAGELLGVWVENATWVDYDIGATTCGMYKL
ncbi:hypothetical protein N1851_010658 [Merluccius polli]|uniref:THD domain-containing protein n=1 Tax=Merluccius polli TaxID=89951 RepID=A0AA47MZD7_MERPO|nr:hypothetical protein N1851_010658 [Merluccius polli]